METSVYNEVFAKVAKEIKKIASDNKFIKQVMAEENPSRLCPYMQFVRLDALNKEDYPHGIDMNSVYICFCINQFSRYTWTMAERSSEKASLRLKKTFARKYLITSIMLWQKWKSIQAVILIRHKKFYF